MNEESRENEDDLHVFRSRDGQLLRIRALNPEDDHHLVDLFDHMGQDSRAMRFNLALPNPDRALVWAEAKKLATINPDKDGAWLVFADTPDQKNVPVGGARYMGVDDHTAEAALVVRDDMQKKGIGRELMNFLVERAREAGIQKLVAIVRQSNRPIFRLLQKADLQIEYESKGGYTTITAIIADPKTSP